MGQTSYLVSACCFWLKGRGWVPQKSSHEFSDNERLWLSLVRLLYCFCILILLIALKPCVWGLVYVCADTVLISVPLQFQRLNSLKGGKLNTILPVKREHLFPLQKHLRFTYRVSHGAYISLRFYDCYFVLTYSQTKAVLLTCRKSGKH